MQLHVQRLFAYSRMADVVATFELVTVFGDAQSAERARALVRQTGSVRIGPWQVPIAEPTFVNAVEVTVWPLGLGYSGACTDERLNCPAVLNLDLDDVADQLSDLLRRFDGYLTAMVGWDLGTDVDLCNLEEAVADPDDMLRQAAGLGLADDLVRRWNLSEGWELFAPGHQWRPRRNFRRSA